MARTRDGDIAGIGDEVVVRTKDKVVAGVGVAGIRDEAVVRSKNEVLAGVGD